MGKKTYKRGVKEEINVARNAIMSPTRSCKDLDRQYKSRESLYGHGYLRHVDPGEGAEGA